MAAVQQRRQPTTNVATDPVVLACSLAVMSARSCFVRVRAGVSPRASTGASGGRWEAWVSLVKSDGFSLIELLLVLAVLGVCLAACSVSLVSGLAREQARAAAQDWQAAAAWAQVGVLWQGGKAEVGYNSPGLEVSHDYGLCGGALGSAAPCVPASANVNRWMRGEAAVVGFGGRLASPDGGGSLFFGQTERAYRVIVRPESGLTVRSRAEVTP